MKIQKIEHHRIDLYYEAEIDEDFLAEVYSDLEPEEISKLMADLESGDADIEQVIDDACGEVDIDWDGTAEDMWTDRKGGYDISYEVLDSSDSEE